MNRAYIWAIYLVGLGASWAFAGVFRLTHEIRFEVAGLLLLAATLLFFFGAMKEREEMDRPR